MNPIDKVLDKYKNLSPDEKVKFKPILEQLSMLLEAYNEGLKRTHEFSVQFTTVVGVLFGVLATLNTMGENKWENIAYLVGIVCCGVCLCLCIIALYQPVHRNKKRQEDILQFFMDELNDKVSTTDEDNAPKQKKCNHFKNIRIAAYIFFGISVLCILAKVIMAFCATVGVN